MLDNQMLRAIGALMSRTAQACAGSASANEVIDFSPLLRHWRAAAHTAGDICEYGGMPYRCIQTHDATGSAAWTPPDTPALWAPYHATDAAHALPYAAPTHAGDAYQNGECMIWQDGTVYRCVRDATVYGPDVLPDAWEVAEA